MIGSVVAPVDLGERPEQLSLRLPKPGDPMPPARPSARRTTSSLFAGSIATSPVFDTYWRFAAERQEIYLRRLARAAPPWTEDPILRAHRFTNVYRAADRVSQFLIRNVIYVPDLSAEDAALRVLLFKLFNRIETWIALEREMGEIRFASFDVDRLADALDAVARRGSSVYSAAYIMPPPSRMGEASKHRQHLRLLARIMSEGFTAFLAHAPTLRSVYERLLGYPGLGPFLAYQYAIDLNYSELLDFSESEFVVPGPGAARGIRKCFPGLERRRWAEAIGLVREAQQDEFERLGLRFWPLGSRPSEPSKGRPLQLIDCQNLFCEVDKYARLAHPETRVQGERKRIKQRFRPLGPPPPPWFPPKWEINRSDGLSG